MNEKAKRLESLFNNELFNAMSDVSDSVYIFANDPQTGISRWSKSAIEYFGLSSEYFDSLDEWLDHIYPFDLDGYMKDVDEVFSGVKKRHSYEYRAKNKDGEYVWLVCNGTMIYDENGKNKLFAGIMNRIDVENKYDGLTHLKNATALKNETESYYDGFAMLIGFDNFRNVVSKIGIAGSDTLLSSYATRLHRYCRSQKDRRFVYRYGGDEFLVCCKGTEEKTPQEVFNDLQELAIDIKDSNNQKYDLKISGGLVYCPKNAKTYEELITRLESSIAFAKEEHRGTLVHYSEEIEYRMNRKTSLSLSVTKAIENDFDGFQMYFQPLIDPETHMMGACEALIRWTSKELGPVSAYELINHVEQSGQIIELGKWILKTCFTKAKHWQTTRRNFNVGINISYHQYQDPTFVDYIIETAEEIGVDPTRIALELTETAKIHDMKMLADIFEKLRTYGFRVSLDDFGVAYSNLELLDTLDVDSVKIDQQFVSELESKDSKKKKIVDLLIDLCESFGINVIVEGVETKETLDILNRVKIYLIQGYYYAKPMPVMEFEQIIDKVYA